MLFAPDLAGILRTCPRKLRAAALWSGSGAFVSRTTAQQHRLKSVWAQGAIRSGFRFLFAACLQ